jgi:hypothetical protein
MQLLAFVNLRSKKVTVELMEACVGLKGTIGHGIYKNACEAVT